MTTKLSTRGKLDLFIKTLPITDALKKEIDELLDEFSDEKFRDGILAAQPD